MLAPYAGASEYEHQGERVVHGQRLMQAASDAFLGWVTGTGERQREFYVRQLRDMKGSAAIEMLPPARLARYGELCGYHARTRARPHRRRGEDRRLPRRRRHVRPCARALRRRLRRPERRRLRRVHRSRGRAPHRGRTRRLTSTDHSVIPGRERSPPVIDVRATLRAPRQPRMIDAARGTGRRSESQPGNQTRQEGDKRHGGSGRLSVPRRSPDHRRSSKGARVARDRGADPKRSTEGSRELAAVASAGGGDVRARRRHVADERVDLGGGRGSRHDGQLVSSARSRSRRWSPLRSS